MLTSRAIHLSLSFVFLLALSLFGAPLAEQRPSIPFSSDQSQNRREQSRFPHKNEKHRTLECMTCHTIPEGKIDGQGSPGHLACIRCHNFAEAAVNDFSGYCGVCHTDLPTAKEEARLFSFPKLHPAGDFGINFSHTSHTRPFSPPSRIDPGLKIPVSLSFPRSGDTITSKCSDCHSRDASATITPDLTLPSGHQYCYVCHGTSPVTSASAEPPSRSQCTVCHKLDVPSAAPSHSIVDTFLHRDHELDIRKRKKGDPVARDNDLCVLCHDTATSATRLADIAAPGATTCGECHNGGLGFPDPLAQEIKTRLRAE